jgi:hypothetical protein
MSESPELRELKNDIRGFSRRAAHDEFVNLGPARFMEAVLMVLAVSDKPKGGTVADLISDVRQRVLVEEERAIGWKQSEAIVLSVLDDRKEWEKAINLIKNDREGN